MTSLEFTPVRDRRPLAVQVYDRLHDALATAERVGTEVPTELELVDQLGVSRTTVRQALALLEEDGVLERGAGRRRIVAAQKGAVLDNPPLEEMIASTAPLAVQGLKRRTLPATRWSSGLLGVEHHSELTAWESVITIQEKIVASALELTVPEVGNIIESQDGVTLLAALGPSFRAKATQTFCRITSHSAATRDQFDGGIGAGTNAVVFTQVLSIHDRPVYLAKHVIRLGDVSMTLVGAAT